MSSARPPSGPPRRRVVLVCAGVLVVAGALLTWAPGLLSSQASPPAPYAVAASPVPTSTPDPPTAAPPTSAPATTAPRPGRRGPRPPVGVPQRLRIPSLGVDAPVVGIVDSGRAIVPPDDPQVLGWWSPGARPGARLGSALIAGHTVSSGGGALDHLGDLEVGDRVSVRTADARMPYVVRKVRVLGKGELKTKADRLFDQDVQGRLVIITCADWNGREYLSNVVVTALPWHRPAWLARNPGRTARLSPHVIALRR